MSMTKRQRQREKIAADLDYLDARINKRLKLPPSQGAKELRATNRRVEMKKGYTKGNKT